MGEPDDVMAGLGRALQAGQEGDRDRARRLLVDLWEQVGDSGDPLHRCAVAHHLADLQDDPGEELAWDLRALSAADLVSDARAAQAGVTGPAAGFYPSLHLNAGESYRKVGDHAAARRHLDLGLAAASSLGDDGYATMVRRGLDGLADRLSAELGPS